MIGFCSSGSMDVSQNQNDQSPLRLLFYRWKAKKTVSLSFALLFFFGRGRLQEGTAQRSA